MGARPSRAVALVLVPTLAALDVATAPRPQDAAGVGAPATLAATKEQCKRLQDSLCPAAEAAQCRKLQSNIRENQKWIDYSSYALDGAQQNATAQAAKRRHVEAELAKGEAEVAHASSIVAKAQSVQDGVRAELHEATAAAAKEQRGEEAAASKERAAKRRSSAAQREAASAAADVEKYHLKLKSEQERGAEAKRSTTATEQQIRTTLRAKCSNGSEAPAERPARQLLLAAEDASALQKARDEEKSRIRSIVAAENCSNSSSMPIFSGDEETAAPLPRGVFLAWYWARHEVQQMLFALVAGVIGAVGAASLPASFLQLVIATLLAFTAGFAAADMIHRGSHEDPSERLASMGGPEWAAGIQAAFVTAMACLLAGDAGFQVVIGAVCGLGVCWGFGGDLVPASWDSFVVVELAVPCLTVCAAASAALFVLRPFHCNGVMGSVVGGWLVASGVVFVVGSQDLGPGETPFLDFMPAMLTWARFAAAMGSGFSQMVLWVFGVLLWVAVTFLGLSRHFYNWPACVDHGNGTAVAPTGHGGVVVADRSHAVAGSLLRETLLAGDQFEPYSSGLAQKAQDSRH